MAAKGTRRDEIMAAAVARFARVGFKKTTLDEVAGDVGMVKSALYKYFASKDDLFDAVIGGFADAHMRIAAEAVEKGRDTEEKLRFLLLDVYDFSIVGLASVHRPSIEVWHEMRPRFLKRTAHHHASAIDFVTDVIRGGVEHGEVECKDPRMVAIMIHLMIDSMYEQVLLGEMGEDEGRRYVGFLVSVIMDGLRAKPGPKSGGKRVGGRGR